MGINKIIEYPGNLSYTIYNTITGLGSISNLLWGFLAISFSLLLFYITFYRNNDEGSSNDKLTCWFSPGSSFFFLLVTSLGILLLRLPAICAYELNTDESEWITGAATLLNDSRFWLSVNGTTSGPLNIFPLCLINIIGLSLNYANVRLFAILFCILPVIILVYKSFLIIYNDRIAKIIVLVMFLFFSISEHADIVAFNSEHIPMLLTAMLYYFFIKIQFSTSKNENSGMLYLVICGIIIGILPLAKLQASTISFAFIIGIIIANIISKEKSLVKNIALLGGVLVPVLFVISYLFLYNLTTEFWNYYVLNNFAYSKSGLYTYSTSWLIMQKDENAVYWYEKLLVVPRLIFITKDTILFWGSLSIISFGSLFFLRNKLKSIISKNKLISLFFLFSFIMAYIAVIKPGNIFLHYILLLVIPAIYLVGYLLGLVIDTYKQNSAKILVYVKYYMAITVIVPVIIFALNGNCYIRDYLHNYPRRNLSGISASLKKYSQPGDRLAVWGYLINIYVEAELIQGTREPTSYLQISESTLQKYFTDKYCEDIITNKPAVFVDAVGKNSVFYYDYSQRYENFPAIKEVIDNNYELKETVDDVRIFTRKIR